MEVSNCCGDPGTKLFDKWNEDGPTYKDLKLCGECGEHCEYEDEETKEENITKVWDSLK